MRYRTIVADPPWPYPDGFPSFGRERKPLPYPSMTVAEIAALPVGDLLEQEGYVFLWATNKYLDPAFDVLRAWTCTYKQILTWCKEPMGIGLGGMFATTTEFVLVGQRITAASHSREPRTKGQRLASSWFRGKRPYDQYGKPLHSAKPEAFIDMVETVSPGPYLELFARRQRLGWSTWGNECFNHVEMPA